MAGNAGKLPFNSEEEKKAFFEKETKDIMKEVEELSKEYCGVEACVVICNPFGGDDEIIVWPSKEGALDILSRCETDEADKGWAEKENFVEVDTDEDEYEEVEEDEAEDDREKELTEITMEYLCGMRDLKDISDTILKDMAVLVERRLSDISNHLSSVGSDASTSAEAAATDLGKGKEKTEDEIDEAEGDAAPSASKNTGE